MHKLSSILIVDDSRTMTEIVARMLMEAGYVDVDRAYDGMSAIKMLVQKKYDLVITDWQMEPISGPDLIKRIRENPSLSGVRIILMTTLQGRDDDAWLDGADAYIAKPFDANILSERVEELLSALV